MEAIREKLVELVEDDECDTPQRLRSAFTLFKELEDEFPNVQKTPEEISKEDKEIIRRYFLRWREPMICESCGESME